MGLTEAIIVVIVLAVAIIAALAFTMSRPNRLRPHRRTDGRPPARVRRMRRRERDRV